MVTVFINNNKYISYPTPSIDAYLFDEQLRQVSSRSDLKRGSAI